MPQNSQQQEQAAGEIDISTSTGVNKGRLDLLVLRHMAYRVSLALKGIEEDATSTLPALSYSEEHHNRMHLHEVDRKLIAELIGTPGILSYSSLELHTGRWYNLVLFRDATTKEHIKSSKTHKYAAYQLAPRYYEWIRLHNGIMPQGLTQCDLVLQKTKLYTFQGPTIHPTINDPGKRNVVGTAEGRLYNIPRLYHPPRYGYS